MPANTAPIYTLTPKIGFGILSTANTTEDLSTNAATVFTAGSNGGFLKHIRIRPDGTNVATKVMVFINNGGALGTTTNNTIYDEITVAATTAAAAAAIAGTEIPMNIPIPALYLVLCTTHTTVTAIYVTGVGGDY